MNMRHEGEIRMNRKHEGAKRVKKGIIGTLCSIIAFSLIGLVPVAAQELKVEAEPTNTAALTLAKYAVDLKYEDLPPDVVAITKRRILDAIGTAYGAYNAPSMVALRKVIAEEGGTPESTIIGSGQKTSAINATMVSHRSGP